MTDTSNPSSLSDTSQSSSSTSQQGATAAPSLDSVLSDIHHPVTPVPMPDIGSAGGTGPRNSPSAGMEGIEAHTGNIPGIGASNTADGVSSSSGMPIPGYQTSVNTQPPVAETNEVWETHLSDRQRRLPKLDLKAFGSLVALLLFVVGLGSATYLTQFPQDVRNQAYEATLPEIAGTSATLTAQQLAQKQAEAGVVSEEEAQTDVRRTWMVARRSPLMRSVQVVGEEMQAFLAERSTAEWLLAGGVVAAFLAMAYIARGSTLSR